MNMFKKIFISVVVVSFAFNMAFAEAINNSEDLIWDTAKISNDYSSYISKYPSGKHIEVAYKKQNKINNKIDKRFKNITNKGNFSKITISKGTTKFFYENTSVNDVAKKLNYLLKNNFYELEEGSITSGKYGKGDKIARSLVGCFENRELYEISIKQDNDKRVSLEVKKAMNGFSGGLVGVTNMALMHRKFINTVYQANL